MNPTKGQYQEQLELKIVPAFATVEPGEETPIEVVLTNRGDSPLVVNARLGVGYADSNDRELYLEIEEKGKGLYSGYRDFTVDYRRKPLTDDSFPTLLPGESLQKSFDLQYWYRLTHPGTYTVSVIYDAESPPPSSGAAQGLVISTPINIVVTAPAK